MELIISVDPDVVLLAVCSPHVDALDFVETLAKIKPKARILLVDRADRSRSSPDLTRAGVSEFLPTSSSIDVLLDAILRTTGGGSPRGETDPQRRAANVPRPGAIRRVERLTERERGVLALIARGLSSKEIAAALSLSPRTVECHRANIMQKLDLHKVAELVLFAVREGFITVDGDVAAGTGGSIALEPAPAGSTPQRRWVGRDLQRQFSQEDRNLTT